MMHLSKVPVLRILVPYGSGILSGYTETQPGDVRNGLWCMLLFLAILVIEQRVGKGRSVFSMVLFWLAASGTLFFCGRETVSLAWPRDPCMPLSRQVTVCGTISGPGENRNGRRVYPVDVSMVGTPDTCMVDHFTIKAYLYPGSPGEMPRWGESWLLTGRLLPFTHASNPRETDYAVLLERKNTWYMLFTADPSIRLSCSRAEYLSWRVRLRSRVEAHFRGDDRARALLLAVCLGDRTELDPEMRASFSDAGGMHLLAVSGLHVGLVWWVLHRLLYFLAAIFRREIARTIPVILILWCYAWFTGLYSPVLRSVIMFSLYSFSRLLSWKTETVNVVLIALLVLLTADPVRIFEAGFQLSFTAVLAILIFQPFLRSIWSPRNRLVSWCWDVTTVSLAAQLGTFPLVVFYFGQFPAYGIITNLLAVPILMAIMVCFVVGFPCLVSGLGGHPVGSLMMLASKLMVRIMESVTSFPGALISGLSMNTGVTAAVLLCITLLAVYVLTGKFRYVILAMGSLGVVFFLDAGYRLSLLSGREVLVLQFRDISMVSLREGQVADHYLWSRGRQNVQTADRYLEESWSRRTFCNSVMYLEEEMHPERLPGGISACIRLCPGVWYAGNDRIRILVVSGSSDLRPVRSWYGRMPDVVLLREEPDPDDPALQFWIKRTEVTVADGSNGSWYLTRLARHPSGIHITPTRGSFCRNY